MEKAEYRVKARCAVCGKDFLARYTTGSRAKICTPKAHVCKGKSYTDPAGRPKRISCVEACCRSKRRAGLSMQFFSGVMDRSKLFEDQAELDRVLREARKIPEDPGMAIRLIAAGGLRVGEVLLVRIQDCALDEKIPHVMVPTLKRKGRPMKMIDLDPAFASELKKFVDGKKLQPGDYLFSTPKRTLQGWWTRIQKRAGVKILRGIHSLRHTHFTRLAELGVDPKYSQQRAGWASLEMYKVYAHVTEGMRKGIVSKLPKV